MTVDTSEGCAAPALSPPPILPWNDFDTSIINDRLLAVRLIAEILQDDEWHFKDDVVDEVVYECELQPKGVRKLLGYIRSHGDIRTVTDYDGDWVRLTTRWKGWSPDV